MFLGAASLSNLQFVSPIMCVILAICFVGPITKYKLSIMLPILLCSPDRPVYNVASPDEIFISHSVYLDFLGASYITLSLLIGCVGQVAYLVVFRQTKIERKNLVLLMCLAVPFHGVFFAPDMAAFVADSKIFIIAFVTYCMFLGGRSQISLRDASTVVAYSFLAYISLIIIAVIGFWGVGLYKFDMGTFILPVLFIFYSLKDERGLYFLRSKTYSLSTFLAPIMLMLSPGRTKIGLYFFSWAISSISSRSGVVKALVLILVIVLIAILIPGDLLPASLDGNLRFLIWKLTSFNVFDEDNNSAYVRLVEFVNILDVTISRVYPLIIGSGYGSYFTESVLQFPNLWGKSGFSEGELSSGVFTSTHGAINFFLLKTGVLIPILFYFSIYRILEVSSQDSPYNVVTFMLFVAISYTLVSSKPIIIFFSMLWLLASHLKKIRCAGRKFPA